MPLSEFEMALAAKNTLLKKCLDKEGFSQALQHATFQANVFKRIVEKGGKLPDSIQVDVRRKAGDITDIYINAIVGNQSKIHVSFHFENKPDTTSIGAFHARSNTKPQAVRILFEYKANDKTPFLQMTGKVDKNKNNFQYKNEKRLEEQRYSTLNSKANPYQYIFVESVVDVVNDLLPSFLPADRAACIQKAFPPQVVEVKKEAEPAKKVEAVVNVAPVVITTSPSATTRKANKKNNLVLTKNILQKMIQNIRKNTSETPEVRKAIELFLLFYIPYVENVKDGLPVLENAIAKHFLTNEGLDLISNESKDWLKKILSFIVEINSMKQDPPLPTTTFCLEYLQSFIDFFNPKKNTTFEAFKSHMVSLKEKDREQFAKFLEGIPFEELGMYSNENFLAILIMKTQTKIYIVHKDLLTTEIEVKEKEEEILSDQEIQKELKEFVANLETMRSGTEIPSITIPPYEIPVNNLGTQKNIGDLFIRMFKQKNDTKRMDLMNELILNLQKNIQSIDKDIQTAKDRVKHLQEIITNRREVLVSLETNLSEYWKQKIEHFPRTSLPYLFSKPRYYLKKGGGKTRKRKLISL